MWECKCDCGNTVITSGSAMRKGHTKSCGCLQKEVAKTVMSKTMTKHKLTEHPLYEIWGSIIKRCTNPNCSAYKNYGGRGIFICDKWRNSFKSFYDDMIDGYSPELELDRIDNNDGYYKENCRWVSKQTNARNKRTNHIVDTPWGMITLVEFVEHLYGTEYSKNQYCKTLKQMKRGWSINKICEKVGIII